MAMSSTTIAITTSSSVREKPLRRVREVAFFFATFFFVVFFLDVFFAVAFLPPLPLARLNS